MEGDSGRWQSVREQVEMHPDWVYLNTGTSGLIPKISHALAIELRTHLHRNPTDYVWRSHGEELWRNRTRLAEHLGTSPDRLVLFNNITQAVNTFCLSLSLPAGSEILISDQEYGALVWAWERAAKRNGWTIKTFRLPIESEEPGDYVRACAAAFTDRTRLLYVSHILYTTGHVLPMEEILKHAKHREVITFVDGAHAPGMIPLSLESLQADFYAANLHKWAMVPVGAAFLYCRGGMEESLAPWQVSWGHYDTRETSTPHSPNGMGSTPWIRGFELEGTRDCTPWLLLEHGFNLLEEFGYDAIQQRHFELSQFVRECTIRVPGMEVVTPEDRQLRGGLTTLRTAFTLDAAKVRERLWLEYQIEINRILHPTGDYLRISTHIYNTFEEIELFARALRRILAGAT
jgi:isopenicillin-N epimerase